MFLFLTNWTIFFYFFFITMASSSCGNRSNHQNFEWKVSIKIPNKTNSIKFYGKFNQISNCFEWRDFQTISNFDSNGINSFQKCAIQMLKYEWWPDSRNVDPKWSKILHLIWSRFGFVLKLQTHTQTHKYYCLLS